MSEGKTVLFVCVENAGRSQMAEGFFRKYAPYIQVISAGTHPKDTLNPIVIQVMDEIGIDITKQKPKQLTEEMTHQSIMINMGCMAIESCPALFVNDVIDWNISDPKHKEIDEIRKIRDEIKNHVLTLVENLEMQK